MSVPECGEQRNIEDSNVVILFFIINDPFLRKPKQCGREKEADNKANNICYERHEEGGTLRVVLYKLRDISVH
jgi:hypothetical protein